MDFGWPNVEIGWKIANDQLLFLALICEQICQKSLTHASFHYHLMDTAIDCVHHCQKLAFTEA